MAKQARRFGEKKIDAGFSLYPSTLNIIDVQRGNLSRSAFLDTFIQEFFCEDMKILKGR